MSGFLRRVAVMTASLSAALTLTVAPAHAKAVADCTTTKVDIGFTIIEDNKIKGSGSYRQGNCGEPKLQFLEIYLNDNDRRVEASRVIDYYPWGSRAFSVKDYPCYRDVEKHTWYTTLDAFYTDGGRVTLYSNRIENWCTKR